MTTIPGAQALTEDLSFFKGLIVGCGEASALVIAHIMKGTPINPGELTNIIKSAANANQLSGAGFGQTAANVQWDLSQFGISSTVSGFNANAIDAALAKNVPVEIGVSNGNNLTGEPSGLRGHYVTIVGKNSNGSYLVADPNTAASKTGGFVTDTLSQFEAANPFAMITPTGAGPVAPNDFGSFAQCISQCNPGDGACYISCMGGQAAQAAGNILDTTGLVNAINNLGGNIGTGLSNAISSPFKAAGVTSLQDFGWRAVLIVIAVVLLLFGIAAIIFDFLDKSNVQVAGTKV